MNWLGLETAISDTEQQLQSCDLEADKWRNYRVCTRLLYVFESSIIFHQDKIQHERTAYIADMKARVHTMDAEMQQLESEGTKPSICSPL